MLTNISSPNKSVKDPLMTLTAFGIHGKRNHMEDYFDIGYQLKPYESIKSDEWPYEFFYFGVFDGHGGHEASRFAKSNLAKFIVDQEDFWSSDDEDVMRAIRKGFADTHSAMLREMPKWLRNRTLPSTAGTTASILFIKNGKYYIGHVGDSRIVISQENKETKQWIANQLTDDHKPELEVDRIQRAGGEVKEKTGVQRVVWKRPVLVKDIEYHLSHVPDYNEYFLALKKVPKYPIDESLVASYQTIPFLAIARSLGDFWSLNPESGQYIVSPEPDVSCRLISPEDTGIILATDGLWNVMDAMKAVRILQELEMKNSINKKEFYDKEHFITDNYYDVSGYGSHPAQSLVHFAYQIWERKRARADNITVVFARLWDMFPRVTRIPHKIYPTRYSMRENTQKRMIFKDEEKRRSDFIQQITITNCYNETIGLSSPPRFVCDGREIYHNDHISCSYLVKQLVLPPTIVNNDINLLPPKNYALLSNAPDRSVEHIVEDNDGHENTIMIRIKTVTDDPADLLENTPYINARGKSVRDSSAQVSDGLHDFGQPWDQLLIGISSDKDDLWNDSWKFPLRDLFVNNWPDETEEVDEHIKSIEGIDDSGIIDYDVNPCKIDKKDTSASIPQLRCLMNYTPPLRRSKRRIYLSMSEDAKKKNKAHSLTAISKDKRRKSQPH